MKRLFFLFAALLLLAGCSDDSSGPASDQLTVDSPAAGSKVGVPFSLSGTRGSAIAQIVVSGGGASQSAQLDADNWTIAFGTNEVSLGIIQFTINGKDAWGNSLASLSRILEVTNNGSGAALVSITGKLTNNYSAAWKVHAKSANDGYMGYVNALNGQYEIPVQENLGTVKLIAWRDDNGNGIFDDGEPVSSDQPQLVVGAVNLAQDINIPLVRQYRVYGSVTGNVYGRRLGIALYNNDSGSVVYDQPSTAATVSYELVFNATENNAVKLLYYIDDNGNGKWDADPVNQANMNGESSYLIREFPLVSLSNEINAGLRAKTVAGSISGDAAATFTDVSVVLPNGVLYAPCSASSYSLQYYILTNEGVLTVSVGDLFLFADTGNDGTWDAGEASIGYTNEIVIGDGLAAMTNTADFVVNSFSVRAIIYGDDATLFKIRYADGVLAETRAASDWTWTSYVFGTDSRTVTLSAFLDNNADNQPQAATEVVFTYSFPVGTGQSITTNYHLKKTTINFTTTGDPGVTYPLVQFALSGNNVYASLTAGSIVNYWNTNAGAYGGTLLAFNDANHDGKKAMGETVLSTNTLTLGTWVAVTNWTLGF